MTGESAGNPSHAHPRRPLPRAAWWLIWAGSAMAAYFLIVEPMLGLMNRLNLQADRLTAALESDRRLLSESSRLMSAIGVSAAGDDLATHLRLAEARLGVPAMPGDPLKRTNDMEEAVAALLRDHDVADVVIRSKPPAVIGRNALPEIAGPRHQIERLILDIEFTALPETVTAVLADLERSPLVAAVGKVQISRIPDKPRIKCTLTPETWLRTPKPTRR
ncbi:MAG: hypothetical protein KAS72_04580 [Phycisphaerales bacterium]|nr:hypothetical protein [Phycisphaerales bacterium]